MLKKILLTTLLLIAFHFHYQPVAAEKLLLIATEPEPVNVIVTVSKQHFEEDRTWPVIRTEIHRGRDIHGVAYVDTFVFRLAPIESHLIQLTKRECTGQNIIGNPSFNALASCQQQTNGSVTRSTQYGSSSIVSFVKHYATEYCGGNNCLATYWRPYKVQAWWTRSGSTWSVANAKLKWGCQGCVECPNNNAVFQLYNDGPFTPAWNGNTSYTYTYNSSQFKVMGKVDFIAPNAIMQSDVKQNGTFKATLTTEAPFLD